MRLNKDLREFVELLNSKGVEYLALCRRLARLCSFTADIDFFVRPPNDANAATLLAAIEQFGFSSLQIALEDLNQPGKVVQLGMKPNRIDLITTISGVPFEEAWLHRRHCRLIYMP
jgi:hypothetical protein